MKREVRFILEAGSRCRGEGESVSEGQLSLPPTRSQQAVAFIGGGRGYLQTAQSALTGILR